MASWQNGVAPKIALHIDFYDLIISLQPFMNAEFYDFQKKA